MPSHVEFAVHKALAKLPADRFGTAEQFAEALTNPSAVLVPPGPMAVPPLGTSHPVVRFRPVEEEE